jgi:hypothetical protein
MDLLEPLCQKIKAYARCGNFIKASIISGRRTFERRFVESPKYYSWKFTWIFFEQVEKKLSEKFIWIPYKNCYSKNLGKKIPYKMATLRILVKKSFSNHV